MIEKLNLCWKFRFFSFLQRNIFDCWIHSTWFQIRSFCLSLYILRKFQSTNVKVSEIFWWNVRFKELSKRYPSLFHFQVISIHQISFLNSSNFERWFQKYKMGWCLSRNSLRKVISYWVIYKIIEEILKRNLLNEIIEKSWINLAWRAKLKVIWDKVEFFPDTSTIGKKVKIKNSWLYRKETGKSSIWELFWN
jgi:hypothetical protein